MAISAQYGEIYFLIDLFFVHQSFNNLLDPCVNPFDQATDFDQVIFGDVMVTWNNRVDIGQSLFVHTTGEMTFDPFAVIDMGGPADIK